MKYYGIDTDTMQAGGPFSTWKEAASDAADYAGPNFIVVKECPEENELGAPNIYPFNTEEYPDGKEG